MGLFDKKEVETAAPGVAECDAKIANLNQQKQRAIYGIGEQYVSLNTAKSAAGTPFEQAMAELEAIETEIGVTERRRLALQGLRKCEKCGNILVIDSAFCNKCGEKLEALQVEVMKNICPKCGNPYENGAVFCTSCGNKLG
ncbi:MAG: zinc ribbon domain-containing protein [Muribaculaceae bacterium]|nr:zinc ribbon domain-containing protein [Muribaculaceae bacterium]